MKKLEDTSKSQQKHHYVYRITNIIENKYYYGCRSSKVEPKFDLGFKYFSSSTDKEFIKEQKENKDIFKYKVIKIFPSRKEAEYFETKLHEKFQVQKHESFYNKAKNTLMGFSVEGRKQTKEHKINNKKHIKGKTYEERYGEERAREIKQKQKKPKSEEHKRKLSISKTGVPLAILHKQHISKGGQIRWDNMSIESREIFKEKMTTVNNNTEKRKDASIKIKQMWKEPEFLNKMKNRKAKPKMKIEVYFNNISIFCYTGFEELIKEFNFNITLVRKSLKTNNIVVGSIYYPKNSIKTENTIGYTFRKIEKEEYENSKN